MSTAAATLRQAVSETLGVPGLLLEQSGNTTCRREINCYLGLSETFRLSAGRREARRFSSCTNVHESSQQRNLPNTPSCSHDFSSFGAHRHSWLMNPEIKRVPSPTVWICLDVARAVPFCFVTGSCFTAQSLPVPSSKGEKPSQMLQCFNDFQLLFKMNLCHMTAEKMLMYPSNYPTNQRLREVVPPAEQPLPITPGMIEEVVLLR